MLDEDHARVVLGAGDRRPYSDEDLDPSSPRSSTTVSGNRRATGPAAKKTATKPARRRRTGKERVRQVAKWAAIVGLVGVLLATAAFVVLYRSIDIPDPNKDFEAETSFVYYANGEDEVGSFANQNRESIPLGEMPDSLQDAVVAAENRSFWTDKGLDPKGIVRA